MSATQQYIWGAAFVTAIGGVAPNWLIPTQAPLVVNALSFDVTTMRVVQDRTVHSLDGEPVPMEWIARVADAETDASVPGCYGSGSYDYPPGQRTVALTLADWTGNPACSVDRLDAGREYVLRATWIRGDDSVRGASVPIVMRPAE